MTPPLLPLDFENIPMCHRILVYWCWCLVRAIRQEQSAVRVKGCFDWPGGPNKNYPLRPLFLWPNDRNLPDAYWAGNSVFR